MNVTRKRRGVSEIIGTLMILIVTVAGAVFLSNALSDGFFSIDQNPDDRLASKDSIQLVGYDTRDSFNLKNNNLLNNTYAGGGMLCAASCSATKDNIPDNGGTEFIVLHLHNHDIDSVFLQNIMIRNEGHAWHSQSASFPLKAENDIQAGDNYPLAGSFSIVPVNNNPTWDIRTSNEVRADEEVLIVLKLNETVPDILMWDALRILVNYGGPQPTEFVVLSGDAKW